MGLAFWFRFRFWVQVQCFRPCGRDQHALTQPKCIILATWLILPIGFT